MRDESSTGPYDFGELVAFVDYAAVPAPAMIPARDGTQLAVRRYDAKTETELVVVALHGSSAEGSYFDPMAKLLSRRGHALVVVPDLRGHGASGGRRGDVDYIGQLEDDLTDLLTAIRAERPKAKVVLLGHSSGGGLVVRFIGGRRPGKIDGCVLLSPFLGAATPTTRPGSGGWAVADVPKIVELAKRAARGDTSGQDEVVLHFNKPKSRRTGREVLDYTFRMAVSYQPRENLAGDLQAFSQPLLVMAGSKDESFVAESYEPTIRPYAEGTFKVLPELSHFGVVVRPESAEEVDLWLRRLG